MMTRLMTFLLGFVLIVLAPVTAMATNLSAAAAAMAPGTFVELTGMTNWNNGGVLYPAGCGGEDNILQYANKAVWNPIARRFQFSGSPHNPCSGTNEKAVFYDDATNTWGALPLPPGAGNDPRHAYDHNALDPATGNHYYILQTSPQILRLSNGAGAWSALASKPGNLQCCRSQAFFPDFGGGRLIHYDGDWGVWSYNPANNTWTQHAQGNGADGSGLPQLTGASLGTFAVYSTTCQCVLLGGGSGFYKMSSTGAFTSLSRAGSPANQSFMTGPGGSSFNVDPVTGRLLVISQGGTMREFNPAGAGTWRTLAVNVPSFFGTAGTLSESLISAPVSTYGVMMYVKHDDATGARVFLYKHAASEPAQVPSAPSGVAAN